VDIWTFFLRTFPLAFDLLIFHDQWRRMDGCSDLGIRAILSREESPSSTFLTSCHKFVMRYVREMPSVETVFIQKS